MVLWEITLGTAYFLGLKRTYRLALRIQRKLIAPKHLQIRQFVHRRTRYAFDLALQTHLKIQERDIEVGRNVGNWILRWLDRMKPSAHIKGIENNTNVAKQLADSTNGEGFSKYSSRSGIGKSERRLFSAARNIWPKPFPAITMMRLMRPSGSNVQYRQYSMGGSQFFIEDFRFGGVIRNDIRQWILHQ